MNTSRLRFVFFKWPPSVQEIQNLDATLMHSDIDTCRRTSKPTRLSVQKVNPVIVPQLGHGDAC